MLNLPAELRTSSRGDVPSAVVAKMRYLWAVSQETLDTSPQLAHVASLEFKELIMREDVMLPTYITERLCSWCGAVQTPGISCSTRLRSRGRHSCINRKLQSLDTGVKARVKNIAVNRCMLCQHKAAPSKVIPLNLVGISKDNVEEERTIKNVQSYLGCKRNTMKRKRRVDGEAVAGARAAASQHRKSEGPRASFSQYSGFKKQALVADARTQKPSFSFLATSNKSSAGPPLPHTASTASLSNNVGGFARPGSSSSTSSISLLDLEKAKKKEKKLARKQQERGK